MVGRKKTVGEISSELKQKEAPTRDPIELQREMHKDYEKNIIQCALDNKKHYDSDFYIVVITKRERLLENVIRNYFLARSSCPTPDYDQAVYKYEMAKDRILFLWVIPCKDAVDMLTKYAREVVPEERQLLDFVLKFNDGTLLAWSKKLNGEKKDSNILDV